MSIKIPLMITETNLSYAWAKAFLEIFESSKQSLCPICISIESFIDDEPQEDFEIRNAVDKSLSKHTNKKYSVAESAATIFPVRGRYGVDQKSREDIYTWYLEKLFPRLKKRDSRNRYGTYFERMIAFRGAKQANDGFKVSVVNQLEHIIQDWHRLRDKGKRPRHSALQVSCFDPVKDHTGQLMRGFPCLQQVSFGYDDSRSLSVNAFYPTQYIYDRAYGNYLGLCQLGAFMARSLGLSLSRFNCFVAQPELGDTTKQEIRDVADFVRDYLDSKNKEEKTIG